MEVKRPGRVWTSGSSEILLVSLGLSSGWRVKGLPFLVPESVRRTKRGRGVAGPEGGFPWGPRGYTCPKKFSVDPSCPYSMDFFIVFDFCSLSTFLSEMSTLDSNGKGPRHWNLTTELERLGVKRVVLLIW